jgi:alpha-ketoglutarate-dependent taurine dioxygenase
MLGRDAAADGWILSGLELPDLAEAEKAATILRYALAKFALVTVKPTPVQSAPFQSSQLSKWQEVLSHVGSILAQGENSDGIRDGKIWMDVRYDAERAHTFRHSATAQPLHTDSAYLTEPDDVVIFICEHQAISGGDTIFVHVDTIDALARQKDPELYRDLWNLQIPYIKAGVSGRTVPVLRPNERGDTLINWNYYRVQYERNPEVAAFRERFQNFLQRDIVAGGLAVPLKIEPGEVVLFKDQRMLHGRNAFVPSPRSIWKCGVKINAA